MSVRRTEGGVGWSVLIDGLIEEKEGGTTASWGRMKAREERQVTTIIRRQSRLE